MTNETLALLANEIGNVGAMTLGSPLFIGVFILGVLGLIAVKSKGGFGFFLVIMLPTGVLLAQYGFLPEAFIPLAYLGIALAIALGLAKLFGF